MTDDQLRAIEARADASTPGPWLSGTHENEVRVMQSVGIDSICCMQVSNCSNFRNDRDFIAHARADIPALVAEVRRLQREIDRLNAEDGA